MSIKDHFWIAIYHQYLYCSLWKLKVVNYTSLGRKESPGLTHEERHGNRSDLRTGEIVVPLS